MNHFDGFEVKTHVIDLYTGSGSCIVEAKELIKMYKNTAPLIQCFPCSVEVDPVMSDEDYLYSVNYLCSK